MTGQQIIDTLLPYKDKRVELMIYGNEVEFWIDGGTTEILKIDTVE